MPTDENPDVPIENAPSGNRRMLLMIGAIMVGIIIIVLLVIASMNSAAPNGQTIGSPFSNVIKSL